MRFLSYNDMKGHRAKCKKQPPADSQFSLDDNQLRQSKKPSRFSPDPLPHSHKSKVAIAAAAAAAAKRAKRKQEIKIRVNQDKQQQQQQQQQQQEQQSKQENVDPDDVPLIDVLRQAKENKQQTTKTTIPKMLITLPPPPPPPPPAASNTVPTLAEWEKNMHPASCRCNECTACRLVLCD